MTCDDGSEETTGEGRRTGVGEEVDMVRVPSGYVRKPTFVVGRVFVGVLKSEYIV